MAEESGLLFSFLSHVQLWLLPNHHLVPELWEENVPIDFDEGFQFEEPN